MKIVHVIPQFESRNGGPALALLGLASAQVRAGLDVGIVHTFLVGDDEDLDDLAREHGVGVRRIGPCLDKKLKRARGLRARLSECLGGAEVIHLHGVWESILYEAARWARLAGVPYVVRPCGMLDRWSLAQGRALKAIHWSLRGRRMIAGAAAIHLTSREEHEDAGVSLPDDLVIVEPNGIGSDFLESADNIARAERRHVVFLGRLHPKKGCDILIEAIARNAELQRERFVLAGPCRSGYVEELKALAMKLGVAQAVEFRGEVRGDDKIELLSRGRLLVLPSRQENFGNVIIEAWACGTPVVVSDRVGLRSLVEEIDGGVCSPAEPAALAKRLLELLNDSNRCERMGERGRAHVREHLTWDRIASKWAEHYARLAGRHEPTASALLERAPGGKDGA